MFVCSFVYINFLLRVLNLGRRGRGREEGGGGREEGGGASILSEVYPMCACAAGVN